MAKNYKNLAQNVRARINPEGLSFKKAFTDELSTISYSDILVYIRTAMNGVPSEYTQRSLDAGEKVKKHLKEELKDVAYEYQGSVMTNTHIKGVSDIDLLVITDKSYRWDNIGINGILNNYLEKNKYSISQIEKLKDETKISSYQGNALQDLRDIRLDSERVLNSVYINCDTTKSKAIKIKNLSLNREVDTVVANWFDSAFSIINGKGDNRGIQVYNKDKNARGPIGYPFLSITRINSRSKFTNGRLKKMIRFLKNIKADSDYDIKLSSFDFNAICYDIPTSKYQHLSFYELVAVIYNQLNSLTIDASHSDRLKSVDGSEFILKYNNEKLEHLKILMNELRSIYADLNNTKVYA